MILEFRATGQTLQRLDHEKPMANSENYLQCKFTLPADYTGTITAWFKSYKHNTEDSAVVENGLCYIPSGMIKDGDLYIGITGTGTKHIPTNFVKVPIGASCDDDNVFPLPDNSKSVAQVVTEKYDEIMETAPVVQANKEAAATSETNAKASEDNAKASEDAALLHKNTAAEQAEIATTKASEAAGSADDALEYKTAAEQAKTDAEAIAQGKLGINDSSNSTTEVLSSAKTKELLAQKVTYTDFNSRFGSMAGMFTFKGSDTWANISAKTGMAVSDCWYDSTNSRYVAYNGTAWVTNIGNINIGDGAVTPTKTSFFKTGKNLFNKDTVIVGYYINQSNGNLYANATYDTSDFIPIQASTQYYHNSGGYHAAYYDSNKNYISGLTGLASSFTTPSNASYMRLTLYPAELNTLQLELGSVGSIYENYIFYFDDTKIKSIPSTKVSGKITKQQAEFISVGKNLVNKEALTLGYYVNQSNGAIAANSTYDATDYIPVLPNTHYCASSSLSLIRIAFFDVNKVYISGLNGITNPITTPVGAYYVRFSFDHFYYPTIQFEQGDVATGYEDFHYVLNGVKNPSSETVLAFLPSEICVAVGRTIELYNSQVVWCGNINNYHLKWDCTIGKAMKRKFSVTGAANIIGEYALVLTVYDNNMITVTSASTTIKIVSNTISAPKTILNIGDSLTNNKAWLGELRTLSNNQYTMVGTRGAAPLKHEGRSGFTAGQYLAATSYTFESEGVHPFWNPTASRFDWNYYKTNTGISPDAIQIFLGTNGIAIDPTTNAGNIKQIIDYIRQDDANIPIFLVFTLYRSNQDGIGVQVNSDGFTATNKGAWKMQEDAKVYNLMAKLNSLLSGYTNLFFVPISLCHDSEYNFGAVSTPVNPRAAQTELLPTEGTHPQSQGYLQMADVMFGPMAKHL